MNHVVLIGHLGKDPELSYTPTGNAVATFSLAVNRKKKIEGQPEADFFMIQTWRGLAEACANNLKKGSQVAVNGILRNENYEKDGRKVYVTKIIAEEVQFLSSKFGNNTNVSRTQVGETIDFSDDDLPF